MSDAILHFTINPASSGGLHIFLNHIDQGSIYGTFDLPVNISDYFEMYADPLLGWAFGYYVQPDGSKTYDTGFATYIGTTGIKNIGAYFNSIVAQPTNPQVFNICWGTAVTPPCSVPPQMPAVPAGTSIKLVADIANSGPNGKVRVVFKANGTEIRPEQHT